MYITNSITIIAKTIIYNKFFINFFSFVFIELCLNYSIVYMYIVNSIITIIAITIIYKFLINFFSFFFIELSLNYNIYVSH